MLPPRRRVPCVGAVVLDPAGRLLLVLRANEPGAGRWSIPGGRVEAGEDAPAAVVREVAEETGLVVRVGLLLGTVERDGPGGVTYVVDDYRCEVTGGTPRPGDDAADLRWVDADELVDAPTVDGLLEALTGWDALPVRRSTTR